MWAALLAALQAIPPLVGLLKEGIVAIRALAEGIVDKRAYEELKAASKKAVETKNTSALEGFFQKGHL